MLFIIISVYYVTFGSGQDFHYYSNFKFGPLEWGKESMIKDFATLTTDEVGNLPDSFTICSSNFITFVSSSNSVFQLLKQDGSPWFKLSIETGQRNRVTFTEVLKLWLPPGGSYTSYHQDLFTGIIPIVPHSWYHVCLGLDTVSGFLRIVVNGIIVLNEEREEFRNTTAWMPGSLEGKIIVFKQYFSGFWIQHRGKFTNMNIFSSMISLEDMVMRTKGEADCTGAGDYLSWEEMEWSVSGDVDSGPMYTEDLCKRYV